MLIKINVISVINVLSVDMSQDGSIMYAGTYSNGLWKSVNYGVTWTLVTTLIQPTINAVSCNGNGSYILIGTNNSGLWVSNDTSATWQQLNNGLETNSFISGIKMNISNDDSISFFGRF